MDSSTTVHYDQENEIWRNGTATATPEGLQALVPPKKIKLKNPVVFTGDDEVRPVDYVGGCPACLVIKN